MIDLPKLADKLNARGIMQKAFFDMTEEEVTTLCKAVLESITADCPWQYVCDQVPAYKAKCKGSPDRCDRAVHFGKKRIPQRTRHGRLIDNR